MCDIARSKAVLADCSQMRQPYDAVVIGSGLGGSTLAYRLAQHGLRVLVAERGDYLPLPKGHMDLYVQRFSSKPLVGGCTKFYGAAMYRMREQDFRATQHEAGESPAWPITYDDLEPYYCEAEHLYRVHGSSEGDSTEPPRSIHFPYPPLPHAPHVQEMVQRLQESGNCVSAIPRGVDYRPNGKCALCPKCDAYYCPLEAKMDADVAALQPALGSGYVDLLTRAQCIRILTNDDGAKATGVVLERDGQQVTVHAEVVAICAGLGMSAQLLLQSRTSRHPRGLGNSSQCVGRYYGGHTTGIFFPLLSYTGKLPCMHSKTFSINTYYNGTEDWPYPMGTIQAAGQIPLWKGDSLSWWKRLAAKLIAERSLYCFYMTEALPTWDSGLEFDGERVTGMRPPLENVNTFERLRALAVDLFRRAGYQVIAPRRRLLWHAIGTVRFGKSPDSSVLDPNCKVHEVDKLYVVDASILPSAGAVNTGLTIAALALRAGDAIANGWKN